MNPEEIAAASPADQDSSPIYDEISDNYRQTGKQRKSVYLGPSQYISLKIERLPNGHLQFPAENLQYSNLFQSANSQQYAGSQQCSEYLEAFQVQKQQQEQPVIVVIPRNRQITQPQPSARQGRYVILSYRGLIALSCFVTWFCGILFGFIAFVLAMVGRNKMALGQVAEARRLAKASFWVSIAGIIVGAVTILAIGLALWLGGGKTIDNAP